MSILHMTKLEEGEEILFGPSRKASKSNLTVKSEINPEDATHTTFRTVCITNKRVIIEAGDSALAYPTDDVQRVVVKRNRDKKKQVTSFNIMEIRTNRGNAVKIEIPGVSAEKEDILSQLFPNAKITEKSKLNVFLDRVLGT
ncbi:MAG: hypothetical protein PVF83_01310 [Anaerolineales bacterium]|jgi:hypothetical protein